jgi:lipopolysaccharide/colanic/teichoic acid biosynthesis glycosyltransferase
VIYRRGGKRLLDVLFSLLGLIIAGPFILLGWVAVRLSSPGPGFFRQERVGLNEAHFLVLKLRTMSVDPNRKLAQTTNSDPEVLPVGRLLRRLKIDELPQVVNVLCGDMSLVGPRPCLQATLESMPENARRRFTVRPGITGLAQVNGNVAMTWPERWTYDLRYVDCYSLKTDLQIIGKTIGVVLFGEERFRRGD